MKFHLRTLGCRLNEAELQTWANELLDNGWQYAELDDADCIVMNTCAVTAEGARKSRQQIRRLHRDNPSAKLVVTGCYASLETDTVKDILGVDWVIDNSDKDKLTSMLLERYDTPAELAAMPEMATEPGASALFKRSRDRAFLKIQDGCRYRCTYCIVTVARGDERSLSIQELVKQVNDVHEQGIQEVVLTGVHVGGYGADLDLTLADLVKSLLLETNIPRIRFASVEPWDLPENFFELFQNPRLMPHMHLPLQSGSDRILRRMSRRCRQTSFRDIVNHARACHPDFNITTDIIVGFPGETDSDWQESLDYIQEIGFSHIHAFTYSDREGTKAHRLPEKVTNEVKRQRMAELNQLAARMKNDWLHKQLGSKQPILWESGKKQLSDERWLFQGYTPNYTKVQAVSERDLSGHLLSADLLMVNEQGDHLITEVNAQQISKLRTPIALKQLY